MENNKIMCIKLPYGSCLKCGRLQFVVVESESSIFLTGFNGEVVDYAQSQYSAIGKCKNCGSVFNMRSTNIGFIPLTPLRELLYDFEEEYKKSNILNPMEVNNE